MTLPTPNLLAILPQIIVVAAALLVLLVDAFLRSEESSGRALPWLSLAALVAAGVACVWLALQPGAPKAYDTMLVADDYAMIFSVVILIAGALSVLLAANTVPHISRESGAFYALLLLATAGMITMGAATDLIVVFLALEILSLALYILVGFNRDEPRSAEASLKYFLLGAFASAFFVFGVALVYGATGTTNLDGIAAALGMAATVPPLLYGGIALLIVGLGFKVALVPFHMWAPDAYQGAPTMVTAFMAAAVKAAGFAAFVRIFLAAFPAANDVWSWALAVLAAATMTLGNLAALRQTSLKRMLAYSSIAHAGYAAVGLVPGTAAGAASVLFYLLVYGFMTIGAFAVVLALERAGEDDVLRMQFAGLAERQPLLAAAMAVFMFSLAGVPPLAGFFAKFYVFAAAMDAGWGWLVLIGVLNSVLSAFYYLYITVQMYFEKAPAAAEGDTAQRGRAARTSPAPAAGGTAVAPALALSMGAIRAVLLITVFATVLIGLWPLPWTNWITQAAQAAFGG